MTDLTRVFFPLLSVSATSAAFFAVTASAWGAQIMSLDFKVDEGRSVIEVTGDGPLEYTSEEGEQQLVLSFPSATLSSQASRPLDTSSFESPVMLVSPYSVDSGGSRVVVQFRSDAQARIEEREGVIRVEVPSDSSDSLASGEVEDESSDFLASPASDPVPLSSGMDDVPAEKVEGFMRAREAQSFSGTPITLKVRSMEVRDVLRLISETSGFNIIVSDTVQGSVTLSLEEVPWDQALDVVLRTRKLGAERSRNVLRVVPMTELASEKEEELRVRRAAKAAAPRITRVIPISYQDIEQLAQTLSAFTSPPDPDFMSGGMGGGMATGAGAGEGAVGGTSGGMQFSQSLRIDPHTRSLIVWDREEVVERLAKMIEVLDTQTPQVMIEGKIIEATESFAKNIRGSLGFGKASSGGTQFFSSFNSGNPTDTLLGSVFQNGAAVSALSPDSGFFGFSPSIAMLNNGIDRINATINMGESERLAKVVASPRLVVVNNEEASIVQETVFPVQTRIPLGQTFAIQIEAVAAALELKVQPQVTNDGNVVLNLSMSRPVIQAVSSDVAGAARRAVETRVVVRDGATLVIGGVYTLDSNERSSGFPILRDIPIIGHFFGGEESEVARTELFMFITPRILNPAAAGMVSSI